uniref:BTB domain-containing protein n=1 Tax=Caenorhabditis tropicalis TaxID=1561998 RepID=A0A1I7UKU8_9PELO
MSDRHKYAFNGVHFFENAQWHMERNNFPRIPIGRAGGISGWNVTLWNDNWNNEAHSNFYIYTYNERSTIKCRFYFNILKNDGSSGFSYESSQDFKLGYCPTVVMTVEKWLDEENGYLINGGINIEYGLQIEGILNRDHIWKFNFYDRLFDCQEKSNMISFYTNSDEMTFFHCHKQLLTFHSTYFDSDSKENQMIPLTDSNHFNYFLQKSHGVRGKEYPARLFKCLTYAREYKLSNVVQLIDQAFQRELPDYSVTFSCATYHGLNRCLPEMLKKVKTAKNLAREIKSKQESKWTGEFMKKCVKRFFEF